MESNRRAVELEVEEAREIRARTSVEDARASERMRERTECRSFRLLDAREEECGAMIMKKGRKEG
jgi:hypothetical protein